MDAVGDLDRAGLAGGAAVDRAPMTSVRKPHSGSVSTAERCRDAAAVREVRLEGGLLGGVEAVAGVRQEDDGPEPGEVLLGELVGSPLDWTPNPLALPRSRIALTAALDDCRRGPGVKT